ncbi:MAG: hypothetical protein Q9202_001912 [Teloschistes flavicans]
MWADSGRSLYYGATQIDHGTIQEIIWSHIEPDCSILAACLPTYAPLVGGKAGPKLWPESVVSANRTMGRWVSSLASPGSHGRRLSGNRSKDVSHGRGDNVSDDESLVGGARDGQWQNAFVPEPRAGDTYHMVTITGGTGKEDGDLEGQLGSPAPLKISVKKDFDIE